MRRGLMKAWLGLGSNLQQPENQLRDALRRLGSIEGIKILRVSHFYRTPPWGDERQDDFINTVAQIETGLGPIPLLHELQSIENAMGRQRNERRWGPRVIDIDLLLYGEAQYQSEELELPHPRMQERAFVLMPLCELDAGLNIPGHGAAGELLKQLDCSGIFRLDDGWRA
ncbi:MAG TPA: 2-amino-4-hydroxy-6-hydroxymethyldihydropteridine diphosphokinase [Xanthomonadales bacterium]